MDNYDKTSKQITIEEELEQKIKLAKERITMLTISNQANSRYAPQNVQAMKKMLDEMEEGLEKLKEK